MPHCHKESCCSLDPHTLPRDLRPKLHVSACPCGLKIEWSCHVLAARPLGFQMFAPICKIGQFASHIESLEKK